MVQSYAFDSYCLGFNSGMIIFINNYLLHQILILETNRLRQQFVNMRRVIMSKLISRLNCGMIDINIILMVLTNYRRGLLRGQQNGKKSYSKLVGMCFIFILFFSDRLLSVNMPKLL